MVYCSERYYLQPDKIQEIFRWCEEQFDKNWIMTSWDSISLKSKEDEILFKLTWVNDIIQVIMVDE